MRNILKKHSTKAERRFREILKELRIPFRFKEKIAGYEIDFLVSNYAIEIDGHEQSTEKNIAIMEAGYIPIHFDNEELKNSRDNIKNKLNATD